MSKGSEAPAGGLGGVICVCLPSSKLILVTVGGAGVFFLGRGVGEGSTWAVGWEAGVDSRPRGAGDEEAVRFAARGGLTLVALGVGGTTGVGCGVEPEAVRFLPVVVAGAGVAGPSSRVTCKPSRSADSIK
jgi:hypothetical protein